MLNFSRCIASHTFVTRGVLGISVVQLQGSIIKEGNSALIPSQQNVIFIPDDYRGWGSYRGARDCHGVVFYHLGVVGNKRWEKWWIYMICKERFIE